MTTAAIVVVSLIALCGLFAVHELVQLAIVFARVAKVYRQIASSLTANGEDHGQPDQHDGEYYEDDHEAICASTNSGDQLSLSESHMFVHSADVGVVDNILQYGESPLGILPGAIPPRPKAGKQ